MRLLGVDLLPGLVSCDQLAALQQHLLVTSGGLKANSENLCLQFCTPCRHVASTP